jgi:hypothetical protein
MKVIQNKELQNIKNAHSLRKGVMTENSQKITVQQQIMILEVTEFRMVWNYFMVGMVVVHNTKNISEMILQEVIVLESLNRRCVTTRCLKVEPRNGELQGVKVKPQGVKVELQGAKVRLQGAKAELLDGNRRNTRIMVLVGKARDILEVNTTGMKI